ncbi:hypothetical protein KR018_009917 [Drosophila ironensis]|nr:hypothetical protein KR018_009917 [Drosophila ironensis]
MSTSGRKRKQQLKPRQDDHRSPIKRRTSFNIKADALVASAYPALADYDLSTADIKPDLTELQLQLAAEGEGGRRTKNHFAQHDLLNDQESDSDEDGYSELNFQAADVFCQDEPDECDPEWTSQPTSTRLLFEFQTPPQQTGLKGEALRRCHGPQHYFNQLLGSRSKFFTAFAKSFNARSAAAVATNAEEMETFVGLSLLISDLKLNLSKDYWSNNTYYGFVGFAKKMSADRYRQLLHWPNFDCLTKSINRQEKVDFPLLNFINERMAEHYVCGQQLVLNDPVILWKGRFSYLQDLPSKFRCNSLLLHMLTEQSGLIVKMQAEIVQPEDSSVWVRNSRQLVQHRNTVVLKLLEDHQNGHTVFASKFYGSYGLAHELAKRNTYCTGLLDRNRYGNSKALVHQQLEPNQIATSYASPLMMGKWRRREKSLYFFSSDCLAIYAREMSMQKTNARPKLIQELDWHLQSGSQSRQQLIQYQAECQDLSTEKKLVIFLINVLVYNAYLLYFTNDQQAKAGCLKTYSEFRLAIIKSLLREEPTTEPVPISPRKLEEQNEKRPVLLTSHRHQAVLIQHNGKPAKKNCRNCHKGGMLQFSKFMCSSCPDKPGLCQDPCFRLWHEQLKK